VNFQTVNPSTEKIIATYRFFSDKTIQQKIDQASSAYLSWSRLSFDERGLFLKKAAVLLEQKKDDYAKLMTQEMGKPLGQALSEVEKCVWGLKFIADKAADWLVPEIVQTEATKTYVSFDPLGTVLGIMPWNFPFWQVIRAAGSILMAGNTFLVKHSPNTTGCVLALEEVFKKAGFPPGVFQALLIPEAKVEKIIAHPTIAGITLTGSPRAGRAVASLAGAHLKKCVLELGGSDAYVILEDANLEEASYLCVNARMNNAGQTCIAAKRFILVGHHKKEFEKYVVEKMSRKKMGDPLDPHTNMGPMARSDLRKNLHRQVQKSIKAGARCLLGGQLPQGVGFYYPPTVLTGVSKDMPAYSEELFGPVAVIFYAKNEKEAIKLANDTSYGLGACVIGKDINHAEKVAKQMEAGNCFVNTAVKSDPRLPFGGIKNSGFGRELGVFGTREFVNVKTMYVR